MTTSMCDVNISGSDAPSQGSLAISLPQSGRGRRPRHTGESLQVSNQKLR